MLPGPLQYVQWPVNPQYCATAAFGTADEFAKVNDDARVRAQPGDLLTKLRSKVTIKPAHAVRTDRVIKLGFYTSPGGPKPPPLATTSTEPAVLKPRDGIAVGVASVLLASMSGTYKNDPMNPDRDRIYGHSVEEFVSEYYTHGDVVQKLSTTFFMKGGTQHTLGRVLKALPEHTRDTKALLRPTTRDEVKRAMLACGFGAMSTEYNQKPWTILHKGVQIQRNMHSGFGFPYNMKSPDVVGQLFGVLKALFEHPQWSEDPAKAYQYALAYNPALVLCIGKAKADMYSAEKIRNHEARFYLTIPAHLVCMVQQVTQPYSDAKATVNDVFMKKGLTPLERYEMARKLHSAQKIGMVGSTPTFMAWCMEVQLAEEGHAYMHCGDDTLISVWMHDPAKLRDDLDAPPADGAFSLLCMGLDMSNFDLTQDPHVWHKIDDCVQEDMRRIEPKMADLWAAMRKHRLVALHGAGTVIMKGGGASGFPMQSELNDIIAEIVCQRVVSRICKRGSPSMRVCRGGLCGPNVSFSFTVDQVHDAIKAVALETGLTIRTEFMKVLPAAACGFNVKRWKTEHLADDAERDVIYGQPLWRHPKYNMGATLYEAEESLMFLGVELRPYFVGEFELRARKAMNKSWEKVLAEVERDGRAKFSYQTPKTKRSLIEQVSAGETPSQFFVCHDISGRGKWSRPAWYETQAVSELVPPGHPDYGWDHGEVPRLQPKHSSDPVRDKELRFVWFSPRTTSLVEATRGMFADPDFAGKSYVYVALPNFARQLPRMMYSSAPWIKDKIAKRKYDVVRLYGTLLSMGPAFIPYDAEGYRGVVLGLSRGQGQRHRRFGFNTRKALVPILASLQEEARSLRALVGGDMGLDDPEVEVIREAGYVAPATLDALIDGLHLGAFMTKVMEIFNPMRLPKKRSERPEAEPPEVPPPVIAPTVDMTALSGHGYEGLAADVLHRALEEDDDSDGEESPIPSLSTMVYNAMLDTVWELPPDVVGRNVRFNNPGGESWADEMEAEEIAAFEAAVGNMPPGVVPSHRAGSLVRNPTTPEEIAAYRALTEANWGRPPPDVAVRGTTNALTRSEYTTESLTKSQKRNRRHKAAKARKRADAAYNDEETHANLASAREEERRHEEDLEEYYHRRR